MDRNQLRSAATMRAFLSSLVDDHNTWTLIGRAFFFRGSRGVFKLEIYSGGTADHMAGLRGTFTPNSGGASDSTVFDFNDHLVGTNPTNNPNFSEPFRLGVSWSNLGWTFSSIVPESLEPLHDAINQWVDIWNITAAEHEEAIRDANAPVRGRVPRVRAPKRSHA